MVSLGTALVFGGQAPVVLSVNRMWVRWLALSALTPSQQLGNSRIRCTWLPAGQRGYLSVLIRLVNPVQFHWARALAGPFTGALASPVMTRRASGMPTTLLVALPLNLSCAEDASRRVP